MSRLKECHTRQCDQWCEAMPLNCSEPRPQLCSWYTASGEQPIPPGIYLSEHPSNSGETVTVPFCKELVGPNTKVEHEEVNLKRFSMYSEGKLVSVWYEDNDGQVYRPA